MCHRDTVCVDLAAIVYILKVSPLYWAAIVSLQITTKAGTVIQPMSLTKEIKVKKAASKNKKIRTG